MRSNYTANGSVHLRILSQDQCELLYSAATRILERTGVIYHDNEALDIMKKAGCWVDGKRVRIPSKLVDRALLTAPRRVTLHDSRTGLPVMDLEGNNAYFGTGSDTPFFINPYTGQREKSSKKSVGWACKVIDALPNIEFVMSLGIVQDVPQAIYDRHQFEAQVLNTSKPIVTTAVDVAGFSDIIEMCECIAGGEEELRRHPFMTLYAEPISPLQHATEAATKLLLAAHKGLPVVYTPCIMAGGTVPSTLAGAMATGLAESLSGLVLNQQAREGSPFIMGGVFTVMDMSSTIFSYGAPEFNLMMSALADMAHFFKLPMFGTAGCTDSKIMDGQAAMEAAISIVLSAFSGANLIHDVGYIEYGSTASLELLVISDEIIGMARRMARGIEVNDETLALDVIDEVGPGGHFLSHDHTFKWFKKETFFPELFDRRRYDAWKESGGTTLTKRANTKVKEILEGHEPAPLPANVRQRINEIVARAEGSLGI